ncbi:MAG TPA: metal-dependent hydrolase [Myxococcaceae bacterium]|nr:metal-dependent hydrolase [Myxococcaceae bacterium]
MDPLAHTLVGAALAETGLRRATALATPTLIIAANLPDVDALIRFGERDTSLLLRRGLTHGAAAMVVLPWLLAGAMLLFDRVRRRAGGDRAEPAKFTALLALASLGVVSHPVLDWLNTYGVRFLAPFSDRWFYGDTLFIVDLWMWLLAGCGVVLARARSRWGMAGWAVLGSAATLLVLLSGEAPRWATVVWCVAVAAIVLARAIAGPRIRTVPLTRMALTVLLLYIASMFAGSRIAESHALQWARSQGIETDDAIASPLPARVLERDVVVVARDRYYFVEASVLSAEAVRPTNAAMPRLDRADPLIAAALDAPEVRGFRTWMRLPSARTERHPGGHRVTLYDVRYDRVDGGERGIGRVVVDLDSHLRVRAKDP